MEPVNVEVISQAEIAVSVDEHITVINQGNSFEPDNITTEVVDNKLRVKDGSISDTKLGNRTLTVASASDAELTDPSPVTSVLQNLSNRIKSLLDRFNSTTGHKHDGTDSAKVDYTNLNNKPTLPPYPTTSTGTAFLRDDNTFQQIAVGSGGSAAWVYPTTTVSSTNASYKALSNTADVAETILSVVGNNNTTLIGQWLFDLPIAVTVIPSGVWNVVANRSVSNAAGNSYISAELFLYHIDGSTTTFYTGNGTTIEDTTITQSQGYEAVLPQISCLATDKVGLRLYFVTDRNADTTLQLVVGDGRAFRFSTPLALRHKDLRDLDGDLNHQHVNNNERFNGALATGTVANVPTGVDISTINKLASAANSALIGGNYGYKDYYTGLYFETVSRFNNQNVLPNLITDTQVYINIAAVFTTATRITGVYQSVAAAGSVSIYTFDLTARTFTTLQTFTGLAKGTNTLMLTTPVTISANTAVLVSNVNWISRGLPATYTVTTASPGTQASNNVELGYSVMYSLPLSQPGTISLNDTSTGLMASVRGQKYVKLYNDEPSDRSKSKITAGGWGIVSGNYKCNATGSGNSLTLNVRYHNDKRFMSALVTLGVDTVLMIPVMKGTQGESCFAVNMAAKKLVIYAAGTGLDDQFQTIGYTTTELNTTTIPDAQIGARDYLIELHKDGLLHRLSLMDTLTGETVTVTHTGWGAGRQNEYYTMYCASGALPTLKTLQVWAMYNPDVLFAGDSITEGVGVTDRTKTVPNLFRADNPTLKVAVSARGGNTIDDLLSKFDTEYNIIRPKIMVATIGTNTGNTNANLTSLYNKCTAIGCTLILNRIPCTSSGLQNLVNPIIDGVGLPGAKYDVATALNNLVASGYNSAMMPTDGLHPNILGQAAMYKRLFIDVPALQQYHNYGA